ncbi:unnamed protein product [Orchesella dallaii]|uniref:Syndetin n=1 Tax=Orchesella dallaii TaxID=48710 RepID=A0ABP1SA97_9HEXA
MSLDLKKKFKNFLQKEGIQKVSKVLSPTSHLAGGSSDSLVPSVPILPISRDPDAELRSHPSDPEVDNAIITSINPSFFGSDDGDQFDPSLYELEQLPDVLDREYIQSARQRVLKELTVVSKKVFQLILEKQCSYTGEIQRVREIEDELEAALFTCKESRNDMRIAKQQFTTKSLGILANYRRRQAGVLLLKSLRTIGTLQRTEIRLREMLLEGDYPGAIQLLIECQQAAVTYNHFKCISELSKKLQETQENAEEQLDVALSKVCLHFDERHYGKLQRAYQLLGKTQTCMDQLLMHYASAIHNTAFSVVHGFAELCRVDDQPINLQKKQYQDLCSCLTPDIFLPCLVDLCKALWKILLSYRKLILWHKAMSESSEDKEGEIYLNQEYVNQKLQNGSSHIWQDIQTKIKTFLLAFDFTGFKVDEFMQILSVIHSLKEVGFEFCESESDSLQDCIRQASLRYFLRYHEAKLDELRIFLESEGWQVCPVRSDFDACQLQEFKFLSAGESLSKQTSPTKKKSCFEVYSESGTPFDIQKEESEENIYEQEGRNHISEKCTDEEYNKYDSEDHSDNSVIITNTTLSIMRLYGRYLHMMHLLKSIAYDVAVCMCQLFEYYFYTIYVFFISENNEMPIESLTNAQLRVALTRIKDNLILKDSDSAIGNGKVRHPSFQDLIDFKDEATLYGLAERIVASESAIYISSQLDRLKTYMQAHIPESNWESIAQLIDQAVIVSLELRKPIFAGVSCKAVDFPSIVSQMDKVNWEVKELMSLHSSYVDVLLRALQIFSMKVGTVSERVNIPTAVHSVIWEQIFRLCCRVFVDGYSNAKKCSNSGRGLMQLDFTQFLSKLEKISPISVKSLPDREYVESYVKAFYMPDTVMEEWLQQHSEYTSKQLNSLVNCAMQGNKRSKQRLVAVIDELEKSRRVAAS